MVKNSKIHVLKPLPIFRTRPVSSGGRSDDLDGDDEDGRLVIDDLVDRDHLTNLKGSLISEGTYLPLYLYVLIICYLFFIFSKLFVKKPL